jgi:hypothetical protein
MIFVHPENTHFMVWDFCLMDSNCVSLLQYFGFESEFKLDAGIEILGASSFSRCKSLALTFESGSRLKGLDEYAFARSLSLQSICVSASLEFIDRYCFYSFRSLSSFAFESGTRLN